MSEPSKSGSGELLASLRGRRRAALLRRLGVLAVLAVVIGGYLWYARSNAPEAPVPLADGADDVPIPVVPPRAGVPIDEGAVADALFGGPFVLPTLEESDSVVRDWTRRLSTHVELATWLATNDLIQRFVAAVDNVAEGDRPHRQLGFLAPKADFAIADRDGRLLATPKSYRRYDLLVDVFTSLDTPASVRAYRKLEPLVDEAYRELGYPDGNFDDTLARAIAEVLRTPMLMGEPELTPGALTYEYLDPTLEELSAVQKQLLRMGPRNASRIKGKLRRFGAALGIPREKLPSLTAHTPASP